MQVHNQEINGDFKHSFLKWFMMHLKSYDVEMLAESTDK